MTGFYVLAEHTLADVVAAWPLATLDTEARARYAVPTWTEAVDLARAQFPGVDAASVLSADECHRRLAALRRTRRAKAAGRQLHFARRGR
jgi:hypothetical protein